MEKRKEIKLVDVDKLTDTQSEVLGNMGESSQKLIDLVQELFAQYGQGEPIGVHDIGATIYEIDVLLEVWDKKLEFDIKILKQLLTVFKE